MFYSCICTCIWVGERMEDLKINRISENYVYRHNSINYYKHKNKNNGEFEKVLDSCFCTVVEKLNNYYTLFYDSLAERYYIENNDVVIYDFECMYDADAKEVAKAFMKGMTYSSDK